LHKKQRPLLAWTGFEGDPSSAEGAAVIVAGSVPVASVDVDDDTLEATLSTVATDARDSMAMGLEATLLAVVEATPPVVDDNDSLVTAAAAVEVVVLAGDTSVGGVVVANAATGSVLSFFCCCSSLKHLEHMFSNSGFPKNPQPCVHSVGAALGCCGGGCESAMSVMGWWCGCWCFLVVLLLLTVDGAYE
jgi:hypothetical protein